MFGKPVKLFKILGFEVKLDVSWFIIFILITWSLATGVFPQFLTEYTQGAYWTMGAAGALGLFLSILIHEFSHSMVARRFGMPIRGITLFIFGGVAELDEEPPNATAEFFMALAGPVASVVIGLTAGALAFGSAQVGLAPWLTAILAYLAFINFVLVLFNCIPAFPLDGGRVLRSILWKVKGNLRWATRISSFIGSAFGMVLIVLGVFNFIGGQFVGGIWWCLIGLFIRNAAKMSYQRVVLRQSLEGEPVQRFMTRDVVSVPRDVNARTFVDDYVYRYQHKFYPVVDGDELVGCISMSQLKDLPRSAWEETTIGDIAADCADNSIAPQTDALEALGKMKSSEKSRLLVMQGKTLSGVITLKDLLRFLSLKIELESDEEIDLPRNEQIIHQTG